MAPVLALVIQTLVEHLHDLDKIASAASVSFGFCICI
jgi:hypothetical protein